MGKLRIAKLAATKVAKAVMSSGKLDNIANSLVNKLGPHKTSTDIIHDGEEAHYLIIQTESVSLSQITSELNGENASHETTAIQLNIFDTKRNLKYALKDMETLSSFLLSESLHFSLFDEKNKSIGAIKKNLVSIADPFEETDAKKCRIFVGDELAYSMRSATPKHRGTEDCKRIYELSTEGNTKRKCTLKSCRKNGLDEHRVFFGREEIAHVYILPPQLTNDFVDKYVIGYNNSKYEKLVSLLVAAMHILA